MARRRLALYAALALCLPLPAHALTRGGSSEPAAPAALSVEATLDHCGLLDTQVVCIIDVAYEGLPEATSYKASVTRADGSVLDYGDVPAGGTRLWVAYAGSGTYTVQISAFGEPSHPGGRPPLLGQDQAGGGGVGASVDPTTRSGGASELETTSRGDQGGGTGETQAPSCEQTDSDQEPGDEPTEEGTDAQTAEAGTDSAREPASVALGGDVSQSEAAELERQGELPESVDCPAAQP